MLLSAQFLYLHRFTWTSYKPHVIQVLQTDQSQGPLEKDTGNLDVCTLLIPREAILSFSRVCSDCYLVVRFGPSNCPWIFNSVIIHSKMTKTHTHTHPPAPHTCHRNNYCRNSWSRKWTGGKKPTNKQTKERNPNPVSKNTFSST